MLASTLFFATVLSSLFTAGSALTVDAPKDVVQCSKTTISWTPGTGPYNVYVFTGCEDSNTDPIATFNVPSGTNSVQWSVPGNAKTSAIFYQVEDTTGDFYSTDGNVGASSGPCQADTTQSTTPAPAAAPAVAAAPAAAPATTPTTATDGSDGTTDGSDDTTDGSDGTDGSDDSTQDGAPGVANAAQTGSDPQATAPTTGKVAGSLGSGAASNAAPSIGLAITLLGAGFLALF